MISLPFHSISERRPSDGQEVAWIRRGAAFGFDSFEIRYDTADYCWFELGEDGEHNGTQIGYSGEESLEGCRLEVMFGNETADPETLWCSMEEIWKILDTENPQP
jgi:hypothetical protein